jgi:hypothetical protein
LTQVTQSEKLTEKKGRGVARKTHVTAAKNAGAERVAFAGGRTELIGGLKEGGRVFARDSIRKAVGLVGAMTMLGLSALAAGCEPGNTPTGQDPNSITIQGSDTSLPSLHLSAAQYNVGPTIEVGATGTGKQATLQSPPTPINLVATAQDDESGIWKLEIWVGVDTTTCNGATGLCTTTQPLIGAPEFKTTEPQLTAGATDSKLTALLAALPSNVVPRAPTPSGSSASAKITIHARAYNHIVNGFAQTQTITYTWHEARP